MVDQWVKMVLDACPLEMSIHEYLRQNYREFYLDVAASRGVKILEIGFGSGLSSAYLQKIGKKVVAIDRDKTLVLYALKRFHQLGLSVPVLLSDAFNLPFNDYAFDVILHEGLLEHFDREDRVRMLNEHLRVAKCVVVDVPTAKAFHGKAPYDERLLNDEEWLSEWHAHFKVEDVFHRTFVAVGAVLTK
jgi:ubiquinone/menaquinone biosynthesis C-methylase UbiE